MACDLHQEVLIMMILVRKVLGFCTVSFKILFIGFDTLEKENSIDNLTSL